MMHFLRSSLFLFAVPIVALLFFQWAPHLESSSIKDSFYKSIDGLKDMSAEEKTKNHDFIHDLDLINLCKVKSSENLELVGKLGLQNDCNSFSHFELAQTVALGLIALALFHVLMSYLFVSLAKTSRDALISSYKFGWHIAILDTLLILAGQTVLAIYTFYNFTVQITGRYFPQMLVLVAIGGGASIFYIIKLLFKKIPLETRDEDSELLTKDQAPELWLAVAEAAKKLGTEPPQTILLGLSNAFFVTEFKVHYKSGSTAGKTLYLSAPMMKTLTADELISIIGHELGHFKGDDTKLSRELYPQSIKAAHTLEIVLGAGLIGLPAFQCLYIFVEAFENTMKKFSRERELIADDCGAFVTSDETFARALTRYVVEAEIHHSAMKVHLLEQTPFQEVHLMQRAKISTDLDFWNDIQTRKIAHPFDSHPPLLVRIENRKQSLANLKNDVLIPVEFSAFDKLVVNKSILQAVEIDLQAKIKDEQERLQFKSESFSLEKNIDAVEKFFPTVILKTSSRKLKVWFTLFSILILILFAIPFMLSSTLLIKTITAAVFAVSWYLFIKWWQKWKDFNMQIDYQGVKVSDWAEPLLFADISKINAINSNGTYLLVFELKEKKRPLKQNSIFKYKRKAFSLNLNFFEMPDHQIHALLYRYHHKIVE